MYREVNALVGAVAVALKIETEQVVRAIECGAVAMDLQADERGEHFIAVSYQGKTARIYHGAVHHAPTEPG